MGTKNNPGNWDCYANADPDEPMFVLLARDVTSSYFVAAWAAVMCDDVETAVKMMFAARNARKESGKGFKYPIEPKILEARQCSRSMKDWLGSKQMDAIEKRLEGS